MRLIIKVLLGLILFNAMLVYFDGSFLASSAMGGSQDYLSKYSDVGSIITDIVVVSIPAFIVSLGASLVISNYPISQCMGASLLVSLIFGLWYGASAPILNLTNTFGGSAFYSILVVCIAVISCFSIIEIFTFKGDAE